MEGVERRNYLKSFTPGSSRIGTVGVRCCDRCRGDEIELQGVKNQRKKLPEGRPGIGFSFQLKK